MRLSAGLLPFRSTPSVAVLLAHPGGRFWARREEGAWSIVKGEREEGEAPLDTALRELVEETGLPVPPGPYLDLGEAVQRGGKIVHAFAVEADLDVAAFRPGTVEVTWAGRTETVSEVDRVAWVGPDEARRLLNPAQAVFVDRLLALLAAPASEEAGEEVADRPADDGAEDGAAAEGGPDDPAGRGGE